MGEVLGVSMSLITEGLGLISPWLVPVAALLDSYAMDLSQTCPNDPPACPTFDASDVTNLVGGVLNPGLPTTIGKVDALIRRYFWFQYCQCVSGSTPPYDCFPAQPQGATVQMPTSITPGCAGGQWQGTLPRSYPSLGVNALVECVGMVPRIGNPLVVAGSDGQGHNAWPIPGGVTSAQLAGSIDCNQTAQSGGGAVIALEWTDANGNSLGSKSITSCTPGFGPDLSEVATIPSTAKFWWSYGFFLYPHDPYTPVNASATLNAFCGPTAGPVAQQPCVTDPLVMDLLSRIYQLLTIVQRQAAPFAYVPGTVHTGLTGRGQLSVQGLLGVKVAPGALPPDAGVEVGDPDELWLDSWITWGNGDGWKDREWLRHSPQVSFPGLAGQYTTLGYSIRPGLAVDITELVREP